MAWKCLRSRGSPLSASALAWAAAVLIEAAIGELAGAQKELDAEAKAQASVQAAAS